MPKAEALIVFPTPALRKFRTEDGSIVEPPAGWSLLPPGDAGLTRKVKSLGPSWSVQKKRGRKVFSGGVWAPTEQIERARLAMAAQREDPAHQKARQRARERREEHQQNYVEDFHQACLDELGFSLAFRAQAEQLAGLVAAQATPVGSGTVGRTQRIPIQERARAAITAWMRHNTTAYDRMSIRRIKGERREIRRALAAESWTLLKRHRQPAEHTPESCLLCRTLQNLGEQPSTE